MHEFLSVILLCLGTTAVAQSLTLSSPATRVTSVELFTSHGCSSCPPADAWLGKLADHPNLWKEFVPLAFHVDYWDWLGWPDRFASAANSRRQRDYGGRGAISTVYTPGFVVNGQEWAGWFDGESLDIPKGDRVGKLQVRADPGRQVKVRFNAQEEGAYRAHAAVLGFGLSSPVDGGENRGKTLEEDFVVLAHVQSEVHEGEGAPFWVLAWPEASASAEREALVVWVSAPGSPAPVQIIGGWRLKGRIGDYGRLRKNPPGADFRASPEGLRRGDASNKCFLWNQETSEIGANL